MNEIWGLPAHPLLIHFPITLVPIAVLATGVAAIRLPLWTRLRWWISAAALIGWASIMLAQQSGEPFAEALPESVQLSIVKHEDLGDQTAAMATLFLLVIIACLVLNRIGARSTPTLNPENPTSHSDAYLLAQRALLLAAFAVGVFTVVWLVRTGHEGARITWQGVNVGG